jgi:23S rRNA A2030 N6-methylase RlmJ
MVLSYRHAFHAGNFADVVKHSALSLLLSHFHRKSTPFYFLDTHAGGALYNLRTSLEANKTLEHAAGIGRLWHRRDYPREMEPYFSALRNLNGLYPAAPGSAAQSIIGYAEGKPAAPVPTVGDRREFAWHHLLHSMGHNPTANASGGPLPHFVDSYPAAAFAPERLELYPGSSLLAAYFQRPTPVRIGGRTLVEGVRDRMVACELHSNEYEGLRSFFAADKGTVVGADGQLQRLDELEVPEGGRRPRHLLSLASRDRVHVVHGSGFFGLRDSNRNVFLPPAQGRGLVLIDPPYEVESEATELLESLPRALKRFPHGMYAIWYPLIDYSPSAPKKVDPQLLKVLLKQMRIPKMLCVELDMHDAVQANLRGLSPDEANEAARRLPTLDDTDALDVPSAAPSTSKFSSRERGLGMTGTGLIVINPPFGFDAQIGRVCEYLANTLPVPAMVKGQQHEQTYPAKWSVNWLTGERIPGSKQSATATTTTTEGQLAGDSAP